jgi:hypothetical protein
VATTNAETKKPSILWFWETIEGRADIRPKSTPLSIELSERKGKWDTRKWLFKWTHNSHGIRRLLTGNLNDDHFFVNNPSARHLKSRFSKHFQCPGRENSGWCDKSVAYVDSNLPLTNVYARGGCKSRLRFQSCAIAATDWGFWGDSDRRRLLKILKFNTVFWGKVLSRRSKDPQFRGERM